MNNMDSSKWSSFYLYKDFNWIGSIVEENMATEANMITTNTGDEEKKKHKERRWSCDNRTIT